MKKAIKYIIFGLLPIFAFALSQHAIKNSLVKDYPVFWADAEGYNLYLKAYLINDGFKNLEFKTPEYFPTYHDSIVFNKYQYGVAILQAPFYIPTHFYLKKFNPDIANGYDRVYHKSVRIAAFSYTLIGLIFLFLALRIWFPSKIAFLTTISIFVGTNLFYYSIFETGMSHAYSFFLLSILLYLSPKLHEEFTWKRFIVFGLIFGLAVAVRFTNAFFIFFTLTLPYITQDLKKIGKDILTKYYPIWIAAGIGMAIFLIPQFIIWSQMKGDALIYTYGSDDFRYWKNPKMLLVLFDKQNGLFVYSPLLIISIIGMIWAFKKNQFHARSILIIFLGLTFLFGSWWWWWFGGAFGHRCYVEWTTLLALPLAFVIQKVYNFKNKIPFCILLTLIFILMYYSFRMAELYTYPWQGSDWTWTKLWETVKNAFSI